MEARKIVMVTLAVGVIPSANIAAHADDWSDWKGTDHGVNIEVKWCKTEKGWEIKKEDKTKMGDEGKATNTDKITIKMEGDKLCVDATGLKDDKNYAGVAAQGGPFKQDGGGYGWKYCTECKEKSGSSASTGTGTGTGGSMNK